MKSPAQRFLSETDREKIIRTVSEMEKKTAGEIVPMVVSSSYSYPVADMIGGAVLGIPVALILSHFIGSRLWIGSQNSWLFLGILTLCFIGFYLCCKHISGLKRLFISQKEIDEEVEEAAITGFFREGLYRTREGTGVLIFISVFEHRVWILADHGITRKVPEAQWENIVRIITDGIKQKNQAEAICRAVRETGRILQIHFPAGPGDENELKNLIIH